MTRTTVLALATFLVALATHATASAQFISNQPPVSETAVFAPSALFSLTIADTQDRPIAGAQVLIGDAEGLPFEGNVLTSDQNGLVPLPQNWITSQPVTIEADGYIRATYLDLLPTVTTLRLRSSKGSKGLPKTRFEVQGTATGFGKLKNDGIFDVGLVFQGVPRADLAGVNVQDLISPETDHMTVFGQGVDIPSNVTIPDQTESYIIPLRFNKPDFRLYLPKSGSWTISTLHARVPFKPTVEALRAGKQFDQLINSFDFIEGSARTMVLTQPSTQQDLAVNQTPFSKSIKFTSPAYDKSLVLRVLAMSQLNNAYYPTDVKSVAPSTSLKLWAPVTAAADGLILAAYQKVGADTVGPEGDQFSAVALPNSEQRPFDPIRIVDPPQVNQNQLVLDTPTAAADLNPVMTYAVLSVVTSIDGGTMKLETKEPVWDVWAPNWVNKIDLPQQTLPTIDPSNQSFRWEVAFDAEFINQKALPPGPHELEKITHVSRSAVELK